MLQSVEYTREHGEMAEKPLGGKSYGSIGHLPGSRVGPGDHHINPGQAKICLEARHPQRKEDQIFVTEKLDGSNVCIFKLNGVLLPLTRSGYHAATSPYEQHHLFANWVSENQAMFDVLLDDGERLVGEWLAQAHGTRYDLAGKSPFVPFDLMRGKERALTDEFTQRVWWEAGMDCAPLLWDAGPLSIEQGLVYLGERGHYGADVAEGFVYRVESKKHGKRYVDFLGKYVRPDKVDGCYLPEVSGKEAVWNWRP